MFLYLSVTKSGNQFRIEAVKYCGRSVVKESSYTNVEKNLLVYNGCDAGENTCNGV